MPTYVITVPERYRQTDRQTAYCGITALFGASRGKNRTKQCMVFIFCAAIIF